MAREVGPERSMRLAAKLKEAAKAFEREQYLDARRVLRPLVERAPGAAAVRELAGLVAYRLGRWREAIVELEAFRQLSGSTEQNPVLADCYRAVREWDTADELWEELRAASPSAELVTEGRIVAAGGLADRGRLEEAVALLEQGLPRPKAPRPHHLRRFYALADLYERVGDMARARQLFERTAAVDPDFADVTSRLDALR
ncbi:MAG: tetratricopeptide repeat protein [Acidimicrobiales bacterium]